MNFSQHYNVVTRLVGSAISGLSAIDDESGNSKQLAHLLTDHNAEFWSQNDITKQEIGKFRGAAHLLVSAICPEELDPRKSNPNNFYALYPTFLAYKVLFAAKEMQALDKHENGLFQASCRYLRDAEGMISPPRILPKYLYDVHDQADRFLQIASTDLDDICNPEDDLYMPIADHLITMVEYLPELKSVVLNEMDADLNQKAITLYGYAANSIAHLEKGCEENRHISLEQRNFLLAQSCRALVHFVTTHSQKAMP